MNCSKNPGNIPRNLSKIQMRELSQNEKHGVMEALDHLFVTQQYQKIGSCEVCRKICAGNCFNCGTHYCSVECQNVDWPRHKTACMKPCFRGSGSDGNNACSSSFENRPVANGADNICHNERFMLGNHGSPFKSLINQINKRTGNLIHENHFIPNSCRVSNEIKPTFGNVKEMVTDVRNDYRKFSVNKERGRNSEKFPAKAIPNSRDKNKEVGGEKKEAEEWVKSPLRSAQTISDAVSLITADSFAMEMKEVMCTLRENENRYWVMDAQNASKFAEIQTTLARECDGYESVRPQEGLVCGSNFGGEWYRGKVVSVYPEKIIVHFIDYGNTSDYKFNSVKELPENLKSFPGLAFLIEFEQGSPSQYKSENLDAMSLTVKETRKTPDGVSCVKIIRGYFGPTTEGSEKQKIRSDSIRRRGSALDVLAKDSKGMIFFAPGRGKTRFGSIVPDGNKNANQCLEQILEFNSSNLSPIEGKEGDRVLVVDREGNDQRGEIISKLGSTYYVFSTDCGNILATDVVFPMPAKTENLIALGVKVTMHEITSMDSELEDLDAAYFHIIGEQISGKWPCALKGSTDQEVIANGFIEKPPETVEADPTYIVLKSGCTVEMSGFCSGNSLYVRTTGAALEEKLSEIHCEMRKFAEKAESLTSPPDTGHLCCVKFSEDGCFYRAQVLGLVNVQKVMVLFVDFGNKEETDFEDIKPLPDALKKIPFFAVKVTLSQVPSKPFTQSITEYLKKLVTEGVELLLTYKESINEGVTLKEKRSGVVVNDFINETFEREKTEDMAPAKPADVPVPEKGVLTDEDLKYTTLTLDSCCDLFLLYVNGCEFISTRSFWATDAGSRNMLHVLGDLTAEISARCAASQMPYHPAVREICLAEFEGNWYRALTVSRNGDVFIVFFLDFGNTCAVKSESIRKMEREFIEAPVLAMNCVLKGHQESLADPELAKKVLKTLEERVNTTLNNVHVTEFEDDAFSVTIPEIQKILC